VLDFEQIKQVPLADVVRRYGLSLRAHRDWLNGNCPLPSHDSQTKGSFAVNIKGNYWLCHSASCQKSNGGKRGGDVIAFVARMESCSDRQAAETKTPLTQRGVSSQRVRKRHLKRPIQRIPPAAIASRLLATCRRLIAGSMN